MGQDIYILSLRLGMDNSFDTLKEVFFILNNKLGIIRVTETQDFKVFLFTVLGRLV